MTLSVRGLDHIALRVTNLARSKAFYTEVLGFEVAVDIPTLVLVTGYGIQLGMRGDEAQTPQGDRFDPYGWVSTTSPWRCLIAAPSTGSQRPWTPRACATTASRRTPSRTPPTSASMIPTGSPGSSTSPPRRKGSYPPPTPCRVARDTPDHLARRVFQTFRTSGPARD